MIGRILVWPPDPMTMSDDNARIMASLSDEEGARYIEALTREGGCTSIAEARTPMRSTLAPEDAVLVPELIAELDRRLATSSPHLTCWASKTAPVSGLVSDARAARFCHDPLAPHVFRSSSSRSWRFRDPCG